MVRESKAYVSHFCKEKVFSPKKGFFLPLHTCVKLKTYQAKNIHNLMDNSHRGWPIKIKPHRNLHTKGSVEMKASQ